MNFVLHFHLAERDLGSAAAGVGAMLPDLWRMADRRVRARRAVASGGDAVLAGIEHHLEADAWFHASPVFLEGERRATELLLGSSITARHGALFAHILWELCLDGALLRRDGLEAVLDRIRAGIASAPATAFEHAADVHAFRVGSPTGPRPEGASRTLAEDRPRFVERMRRILEEVARGPWIDGYQSGAGVAERVQGIRRAVRLPPMDAEDLARVARAGDLLLDGAAAELARLEAS